MENKKILKTMIKYGLPTMIAQIINLLYNIVDKIYIGHLKDVSEHAFTGVGICSSAILIISAFAAFIGNGGAPLASNALGAKDQKRAEKILGNGFSFLIIISIILMIIFYTCQNFYFSIVGGSINTIPYAKDYLNIYLIGTVFILLTLGLNTFLTAQGKSYLAMISIALGAIINLILDPIFIFSLDLGVKGAALATVISQFFSCLVILYFLFNKKTELRIKLQNLKLDFKILGQIFALGISPFVMSITESLIVLTMSGQLKIYGGDAYVGSLTIMQSTMQLMSTPLSGFTQGVTAYLAFSYGAKDNLLVKKIFKNLFIILFIYSFLFTLVIIICPKLFTYMFVEDKISETALVSIKYMPIFMLGMLIFGIQRACQTTFVALKQAKISLFIAVLRKVILLVPLAMLLPLILNDVMGVYLAEALSDGLAAIICGIIFYKKFPKILKNNV